MIMFTVLQEKIFVVLSFNNCFYQIPADRVTRLYQQNDSFYVSNIKFCCRANVEMEDNDNRFCQSLFLIIT